jgi:hypothetical protein
MFYFDLYIINVDVILPPDLGPFAVNKYIHTYIRRQQTDWDPPNPCPLVRLRLNVTLTGREIPSRKQRADPPGDKLGSCGFKSCKTVCSG